MANLTVKYLGLTLKNPIIIGSCALGKSVDGVKRAEEAGASAIVLKSLFEEEIRHEFEETQKALDDLHGHPEAYEYARADLASHLGPERYLRLVEQTSAAVKIPVIASINCVSPETWVPYARQVEAGGAKAIELNVYAQPYDPRIASEQIELRYVEALKAVKKEVKVPVAVKLVPQLTNPLKLAFDLSNAGADGLVLFNRLFHPDIDVNTMEFSGGLTLSEPSEYLNSLRWVGMLFGRVSADLCAATGIHDGDTLTKMLLAGANTVQVTSVLYRQKMEVVQQMLARLDSWMTSKGFKDIADFRGKVSRFHASNPEMLARAQYIKAFVHAE